MASTDKTPRISMKIPKCPKHGEYVPDSTLLGCPDCAAEALAQEKREKAARRG